MVSRPWAFETIVMAVLLEHQKMVEQILGGFGAPSVDDAGNPHLGRDSR
jgi:hypothetical protein